MSPGFELYRQVSYVPWCGQLPWHTLALGALLALFGLRGAFSCRFWAESRNRAFLLESARFMRGFQAFLAVVFGFSWAVSLCYESGWFEPGIRWADRQTGVPWWLVVLNVVVGGFSLWVWTRSVRRGREAAGPGARNTAGRVAAMLFLLVLVVVPFFQSWLVLHLGLYYRAPRKWSAWLAIVPWLISLFIRREVWAKTIRYLSAAFFLGCFAYFFVFSLYTHFLLPESLAYSQEVADRLQHIKEASGQYPDRIDPETLMGKKPPLLIRTEGNNYYNKSETGYYELNLRTIFPSSFVSFNSMGRKWEAWFSNFTE
ncbi:MAG: hypothetical protein KA419_18640 [Acidobacteria bacterium]|nr:hypothetical protein [Acidobacteriota bacterium]